MDSQAPPPKQIFADRYRVVSAIGRGGMGSVWKGEHVSLGSPVAIKILERHLALRPRIRARFLREARSAASLRSKHVVQIFDHGVEDDIPFIVMEFLEGESLGARLRRSEKLTPTELSWVMAGIAKGVGKAHAAGIVHRDLKPDNVFIAIDEDGGEVIKVVDFGIAKILDEESDISEASTDTGALLGTPYYMSPEQARGAKPIDTRADLWAMAVMAFECLMGKRPFRGNAVGELVLQICADAPPIPSATGPALDGFDDWFARALSRAISDRFQTVAEQDRALQQLLRPDGVTSDSGDGASSPRPAERRALEATTVSPPGSDDPNAMAPTLPAEAVSGSPTPVSSAPSTPAAREPVERPPVTVQSVSTTVPPQTPPARVARSAAIAAALLGGAAAIVWSATRPDEPIVAPGSAAAGAAASSAATSTAADSPTATPATPSTSAIAMATSASPASESIQLSLSSRPADVEVYVGQDRVGTSSSALALKRGSEPLKLTLKKKGFHPATLSVVPDRDRSESVVLKPKDKDYEF